MVVLPDTNLVPGTDISGGKVESERVRVTDDVSVI
jgi:hypothetical protein